MAGTNEARSGIAIFRVPSTKSIKIQVEISNLKVVSLTSMNPGDNITFKFVLVKSV